MEIVLGFVGMVVMLIAELFFSGETDDDLRRCPSCGLRGIRIPRVWDMYTEAPTCRYCGVTARS